MAHEEWNKEHRPYTIPYTGSSAIKQEGRTFVAASNAVPSAAAHPPAPQDKVHPAHSESQPLAVRPESPALPPTTRKPSFAGKTANVSTSENDGARRSSIIHVTPTTPFHDEIPPRFQSASIAGTAIITPDDRAQMLAEQDQHVKEEPCKDNETGMNTDYALTKKLTRKLMSIPARRLTGFFVRKLTILAAMSARAPLRRLARALKSHEQLW